MSNVPALDDFHQAIDRGDAVACKAMIDAGINVRGRAGDFLHAAADKGDFDVCRVFLEHGARADIVSGDGIGNYYRMPLNNAAAHSVELCRLLVEYGAKVTAPIPKGSAKGQTPLHEAARHGNLAVCRYLVEQGADVNAKDCLGDTPLHMLVGHPWLSKNKKDGADVFRLLVRCGADWHAKNDMDRSLVMQAAKSGDVWWTGVLIKTGFSVMEVDRDGRGPLHYVCSKFSAYNWSDERAMAFIGAGLSHDYVPDNAPASYLTPFQYAVAEGCIPAVKFFLDRFEVDLAQRTFGGRTLLQLAQKNKEMKQIFLSVKTGLAIQDQLGIDSEAAPSARVKRSTGMSPL